jgi:hypothetical protein
MLMSPHLLQKTYNLPLRLVPIITGGIGKFSIIKSSGHDELAELILNKKQSLSETFLNILKQSL